MEIRGEGGAHILASNGLDDIVRWCAQQLCDDRELIDMIFTREQWFPLQHLREYARRAPHVNLGIIFLPSEHDFGSAVVSGRDIARHLRVLYPRETKITDLEIAVLIDEDVAGLQVAVDDTGGMHVFEPAQDLVEEVLDELFLERAGREESV